MVCQFLDNETIENNKRAKKALEFPFFKVRIL